MIHGRPEAFQGDRFTNIFVHFRPLEGWEITAGDIDRAAREGVAKKNREEKSKEAKSKMA